MESQRTEQQFYGTHHVAPAMYKNLPTSKEYWLTNGAVEML